MIFKELISASTKIRTLEAVIARAVRGRSQTKLTRRWVGSPKMSILGQCVGYKMSS